MDKQFDDVLAIVKGTTPSKNKNIEFELTGRDIKHIRRVLEFWDFIHPNLQKFETNTIKLYDKFKRFGRLKRDQAGLPNKLKGQPVKCQFENCQERINLTIHHINGKRGDKINAKENLQWLCPKHHLLTELKGVLETKHAEIKKIEERIKQVEMAKTSDALGYQINKKAMIFNGFSEQGDFSRENNLEK